MDKVQDSVGPQATTYHRPLSLAGLTLTKRRMPASPRAGPGGRGRDWWLRE